MDLGLSPDQTRPDFKEMCSQAKMAESLDFTALWVHEHHSRAMMYPDPLMALAALVPVTDKVRLGTSMLLLPLHHPVRMAQAAAMLDAMSNGRVLLGVANGYSATDLATFGMTGKHRGRRVQQGIELARRLWLGEPVTADGDDFALEGFSLFPPPVQQPGPPILLGGHADIAIERAATIGDGLFISATAGIDQVAALIENYRSCLTRQGKPFTGVWLNRVTCVVENKRQEKAARDFFARALISLYDSWGHANVAKMSQQQRRVEDICRNNLIIGEAKQCREQIAAYAELGVRHIACLTSFGAPPAEVARRSIRLMGENIIPTLATVPEPTPSA